MIYYPLTPRVLRATALGEAIPSQFSWPTPTDYVQYTASALDSVLQWSSSDLSAVMTPPGRASVGGLRTMFEATSGASLRQLIAGAMGPDVPPNIVSMVTNLLNAALRIGVEGVTKAIGDALGMVADTIPVLGQFVGMFLDAVFALIDAFMGGPGISPEAAQAIKAAKDWTNNCVHSWCDVHQRRCSDLAATGYDELTKQSVVMPADTFRPFAYSLMGNGQMPWCTTTNFLWLCGGEGMLKRSRYESVLQSVRSATGNPELGVPKEVQRRMWKLIQGICRRQGTDAVSAAR